MNPFAAGPSQPASSEALFPGFPTLDLKRIAEVVRRRLWLAVLVAAAFVGVALLYLELARPVYESAAVLYVEPKSEGAVFEGIKGVRQANWESLDALKSMAGGIGDSTVILRVADRLGLREEAGFLPAREGAYSDAELVEKVRKMVSTDLRRGTRLIDVAVRDSSPERARLMAEAFVEEFQELIREQNAASAELSREVLEREAENQLRRVHEAEERLQEFRLRHADVALDEGGGIEGSRLADLDRMLSNAASDVIMKRAEYEQVQSIPEEEIERVLEIGGYDRLDHVQQLLLARNQKRAEFVKIRHQYQPTHPTYQAYEQDLAGLEEEVRMVARNLGESIAGAYRRAVEHEARLRETVQEQKRTIIEVDGIKKEFRTLARAVESAHSTYARLLDRINDTDVTEGVDETVIRVFSHPLTPVKPVSPKRALTLALAGAFGGMCGLALVLATGLLDRTLHSRAQVESTLGLAVLAEIPPAFRKDRDLGDAVFLTREPGSAVSEGVRSLRTSLSAYSPRSVLVTSASPGEGKSFVTANLAVLQANMGYRTLLVDADFRRPRMAGIFVEPMLGAPGEGAIAAQGVCQETTVKNLHLLSCGRFATDSGEPMSGEIFAKMLHEAYVSFDCVIIDTSPVNVVSDGLTYSRHADAVVLVVRAGRTDAASAKQAVRELQRMRAALVGCVLNGSEGSNPEHESYLRDNVRLPLLGASASAPGTPAPPPETPAPGTPAPPAAAASPG